MSGNKADLNTNRMSTFAEFIENEITIMDSETYQLIYNFIDLANFRQGEYEGNMYVIRKINRDYIQLENEVSTANTAIPTVYVYRRKEFLRLLQKHKPDL